MKLEKVITGPAGTTVGPAITGVIAEAGYYGGHHMEMLGYIGARSNDWQPLELQLDAADSFCRFREALWSGRAVLS